MKITHREYGEVDYVSPHGTGWQKFERGRASRFMPDDGWSEVPEKRLVDVTSQISISIDCGCICLTHHGVDIHNEAQGYHIEKTTMYAMPDDPWKEYNDRSGHRRRITFMEFARQWQRYCIVVNREEP